MDKELTEITPKNLDGSDAEMVVNTVQKASEEEVKKAAAEEKERKENYYVDPLEQDALMKEKLDKIEAEKAEKKAEEEEKEKAETPVDDTLRPDMNVSGYFSTGATANKTSFLKRPASANTLVVCFIFGILDAIYSGFYTVTLISTSFDANWFMGWIYAVVAILSIIITINCARSLKAQKESMKRNALVGLVGSGISAIPLIAWLIHWIVTIV